MPDLQATVLFCDDVRQEVGGKASIMGLYRGFMCVPADVPALAKLVALVLLDHPRRTPPPPSRITLEENGNVLAELKFDLVAPPEDPATPASAAGRAFAFIPMELVGYPAKDGAVLLVKVEVGDYRYVSEPLAIVRKPTS